MAISSRGAFYATAFFLIHIRAPRNSSVDEEMESCRNNITHLCVHICVSSSHSLHLAFVVFSYAEDVILESCQRFSVYVCLPGRISVLYRETEKLIYRRGSSTLLTELLFGNLLGRMGARASVRVYMVCMYSSSRAVRVERKKESSSSSSSEWCFGRNYAELDNFRSAKLREEFK